MKFNIKYKLFLAILSAHIVLYVSMYSFVRYNFDKGFIDYLSKIDEQQVPALIEGLEGYYSYNGSWEGLASNRNTWWSLITRSIQLADEPSQSQSNIINRPPSRTGRTASTDWYYYSEYSTARPSLLLLDTDENVIQGDRRAQPRATLISIMSRGELVGYLGVTKRQELSDQDLSFSEEQKDQFLLFAIALVLISALIVFPLSSIMVKPIQDIVAGTRALTSGAYDSRIKVRSRDELGLLSRDFNTLAKTLEHNQHARQQWIADISHELRTPLAVLRGELESIQDGIRPFTPEALDSLHHEVLHLNSLVSDLHELSLSDLGALSYEKSPLDLGGLLELNLGLYSATLEKQSITAKLTLSPLNANRPIMMNGDEKRLSQLFSNLLQNSCRYTDSGGQLQIELKEAESDIELIFSDSGPGVKDEDLPKLFDRLYRVEGSRNRQQGGSGLGLAICKNIVEAHEGSIVSAHSPLGGLMLTLHFSAY